MMPRSLLERAVFTDVVNIATNSDASVISG